MAISQTQAQLQVGKQSVSWAKKLVMFASLSELPKLQHAPSS